MSVQRWLAVAWLAATLTGGFARPGRAEDLVIALLAGHAPEALRAVVFEPFTAASAIGVRSESWSGGLERLRAEPGFDVVQVGGQDLLAGCEDGLFTKLDFAAIGGRDRYLPQAVSPCGVGALQSNYVLAWDRDKLAATPGWAEFWDVVRFPGKRGLRRGVRTNLEIALMADGVAPGDVYAALRSEDGVNRAFRKLDQLKPYIVWWEHSGDAARLLSSGEVLMSTALNVSVAETGSQEHRNFGVQWTASLAAIDSWAILSTAAHADAAVKFLAFAGDPAVQSGIARLSPFGGLAKGASDGVSAEALAGDPTAPAHLATSLVIDETFWRENEDKLARRFDAWITQ